MNRPTRGLLTVTVPLLACLALAVLAPAANAAEGTIAYQHETETEFEQQLANGEIRAATMNKRIRSVRLTLKDGRHVVVKYPRKQSSRVAAQIRATGVRVKVLGSAQAKAEQHEINKKKPIHHKLRYIAGGVLLVVIAVVGTVLYLRRRRTNADEVPAGLHADSG